MVEYLDGMIVVSNTWRNILGTQKKSLLLFKEKNVNGFTQVHPPPYFQIGIAKPNNAKWCILNENNANIFCSHDVWYYLFYFLNKNRPFHYVRLPTFFFLERGFSTTHVVISCSPVRYLQNDIISAHQMANVATFSIRF